MITSGCTFNGNAYYNNGWENKNFRTASGHGYPGYGLDYYGHNRAIVLKFTTPEFSYGVNKQIEINIPLFRTSSGTDVFNYCITTDTPSFSESGMTQISFPSNYMCSGTWDVFSDATYTLTTLTTVSGDFQPNTIYYVWLWSNTPTGSIAGYFAHEVGYGGLITVNLLYDPTSKLIWENEKVSGQPFNLSATEWNTFCEKVLIVTGKTVPTVSSEDKFTATLFNAAAEAVGLSTRVNSGDPIYAKYINDLRDYLNAKME